MQMMLRKRTGPALVALLLALAGGVALLHSELAEAQGATTAVQVAKAQQPASGIKAMKPVLGAACKACPWGAMAEIVKQAMQPYGYEVQICYNCSLPEAPRIVSGAKMPPAWQPSNNPYYPAYLMPKPPEGPVDFGTAAALRVWQAYQGTHDYAGEGPRTNLRLLAYVQNPNYLVVAVKADSGITDLSQIKQKRLPIRILAQGTAEATGVLAYYGLSDESANAAGVHIGRPNIAEDRKDFDVLIHNAGMGNAPEYNIWLEMSQKYDLRYLELPADLLDKLAKDNEIDRGTVPLWLFRGVDRPIATVVQTGNVIYGRADAPDDFAYAVAKALDEQQQLLQWSHLAFYYDVHQVWKDRGLPLHPGAARYYRERGYMK
jgi:TRAP transporter TAXI family solute receptor